jgi:hypothetical protein
MQPDSDASFCRAGARRSLLQRWRRDASGTTAVEFAFVAGPFLMLLFGIMAVGLFFFTTFSLENAVERTGRLIRTGQVQQGGMTGQQFKEQVCDLAPAFVDCVSKLRVNVMNFPDSEAIGPGTMSQCLDVNGDLSDVTTFQPGEADVVVLIWVCYEWSLASKIPYHNLGNMSNGSRLIQAATSFRTEPFN